MKEKKITLLELSILLSAGFMFIYSFVGYVFLPAGTLFPMQASTFQNNLLSVITHAVFSSIAIVTGSIQFIKHFRNHHPKLNLILRNIYFVAVFLGSISGLFMSFDSYAGFSNVIGFSMLAILWHITTLLAFLYQRNNNISQFKIWIVRSYYLTFAAVTLRLYMGIFFLILGYQQFDYFYATLGFLCWVPNVIVVEWFYLSKKGNR